MTSLVFHSINFLWINDDVFTVLGQLMELNKKRLRNAKRVAAHGSLRQRLFDRRGVQGEQEGAVVALVTQIAAVLKIIPKPKTHRPEAARLSEPNCLYNLVVKPCHAPSS